MLKQIAVFGMHIATAHRYLFAVRRKLKLVYKVDDTLPLNQQIKVGSILEREYVLLFCLEIELGLQQTLYCFRTVNIQGKVL